MCVSLVSHVKVDSILFNSLGPGNEVYQINVAYCIGLYFSHLKYHFSVGVDRSMWILTCLQTK